MRSLGLVAWVVLLVAPAPAYAEMAERRFALAVGQNIGAEPHRRLRFAEADAARFASTLVELGGFAPEDVIVLQRTSVAELRAAMSELDRRVALSAAQSGRRTLLLFYWSGHATEKGLEFGSEILPFPALKELFGRSRADVRIAFVDACRSGSLVAAKGAVPTRTSFEVVLTADPSPDGTAIVASSGPGENALESVELRGSVFTHHLTAGLRGAADADGDGRVTFQEAYRYAYMRTVAESVEASGVAQRPTYLMNLKGKGELVLAELNRAEGHLLLAPGGEQGLRWLVVRDDGLGDVIELREKGARTRSIALPSGRYRLVRATAEDVRVGSFVLERGQSLDASSIRLSQRPYAESAEKGEVTSVARRPWQDFSLGLAGGFDTPMISGMGLTPAGTLGAEIASPSGQRLVVRVGYSQGSGRDSDLPYTLRVLHGDFAWLWPLPWKGLRVGARLGGGVVMQKLEGADSGTSPLGLLGAVVSFRLPLFERVAWTVECEPHLAAFRLNESFAVRPGAHVTTGLEVKLW